MYLIDERYTLLYDIAKLAERGFKGFNICSGNCYKFGLEF